MPPQNPAPNSRQPISPQPNPQVLTSQPAAALATQPAPVVPLTPGPQPVQPQQLTPAPMSSVQEAPQVSSAQAQPQVAAVQSFTPQSASGDTAAARSNKPIIIAVVGIGVALLIAAAIGGALLFANHNKQAEIDKEKAATVASTEAKQDKKLTEVIKPPEVKAANPSESVESTQGGILSAQERTAFMQSCQSGSQLTSAECSCVMHYFETTMSRAQYEAFSNRVLQELTTSQQLSAQSQADYQKALAACL